MNHSSDLEEPRRIVIDDRGHAWTGALFLGVLTLVGVRGVVTGDFGPGAMEVSWGAGLAITLLFAAATVVVARLGRRIIVASDGLHVRGRRTMLVPWTDVIRVRLDEHRTRRGIVYTLVISTRADGTHAVIVPSEQLGPLGDSMAAWCPHPLLLRGMRG